MKKKGWFSVLQNLSWLTQLGLSLAAPPVLCLLGAGWLARRFSLGPWVYFAAIVLGLGAAACTFAEFVKMFRRKNGKKSRLYGRKTRRAGRRPEAGAGCDRLFMKIQEATKRETLHIAAGTLAFSAVMNGVFALLGRWGLTVLWGTLLGGGFAVLNFFLLGLTVQKMAGDPNEKKGKLVLQLSYSLRMLATLAVVVLGVKLACFSWVATVIPLLFPRLTILAMQILGMYKPPKNKEGGDEPV